MRIVKRVSQLRCWHKAGGGVSFEGMPMSPQHAEQSRNCEQKNENRNRKGPRATKTMRPMGSRKNIPGIALLFLLLATAAAAQSPRGGASETNSQDSEKRSAGQIQTPNRPASPLFKGSQGKQRTEIHFDPATRTVTIKLLVQDPNGYFIPTSVGTILLSTRTASSNRIRRSKLNMRELPWACLLSLAAKRRV